MGADKLPSQFHQIPLKHFWNGATGISATLLGHRAGSAHARTWARAEESRQRGQWFCEGTPFSLGSVGRV